MLAANVLLFHLSGSLLLQSRALTRAFPVHDNELRSFSWAL